VDLSSIGKTQRTHRALVAWFSSPRVAVRTAFRLADTVPSLRVVIRAADDHGAEGPVVAMAADVPWLWSTLVSRQLTSLGVALIWDPESAERDPGARSAA
jgi:hypothetical protein